VLAATEGHVGRITLNRPTVINALTLPMIRRIADALERFSQDPSVAVVVLDGRGDRGFCAGGDIKFVHEHANSDPQAVRTLWAEEYRLDASIAHYPKPVVAIADGITMGGGIGLFGHASHRVVTQTARLAMPETAIGLSPDVAGLFLLSRAPGELGTHAALTGARCNAADALEMGLADYVVDRCRLGELAAALQREPPDLAVGALHDPSSAPRGQMQEQRGWIDACYASDDVGEILARLTARPEPAARAAAANLASVSPTAATVTLAAVRRAAQMTDMRECLRQDYRLSCRFLQHPDLVEGIRAKVVDKDRRPRWRPGSLAAVDPVIVPEFFAPFPDPADELDLPVSCS
jgi:enoyl-CoA hydratase